MEKHGMVRGRWFRGTGLLTAGLLAALCIVCPRPLCGQETQEGANDIAISLESSPEHPVVDGSWRVSILVDHPVPDEVTVIPPELPPSLSFAQSRKETRFVRTSAEQGTRWTLVEFLFVPHRTGAIVLEPFEAQVRGASFRTPPARTTVTTREGAPQEYRPRLVWDRPPPVLRIGESAELILRVLDKDPEKPLRRLPLHLTAPAEALQEELPLSAEEQELGLALRLRITALGGSRISLGPFPLGFETLSLEAPAISIALAPPRPGNAARAAPVEAAAVQAAPSPTAVEAAIDGPERSAPPPVFPETRSEPFPLFRGSYRDVLDKARERWQQALYAEALGELRRGERDLLSGPALASTRRAAEQALGLPPTGDEKWRPRNFVLALIILSFCLLLVTIALPLRTRRGRGPEKRRFSALVFRGYGIVLFALIGVICFGLAALARFPGEGPFQGSAGENAPGKRPGNTALALRSCVAYRVPDTGGAVSARWREGQPVRVRSASASWAYAESSEGDAGWVSQEDLIFY